MSNPVTNLPLAQSFFLNGISKPEISKLVYDSTLGYNQVSSFINQISGGVSKSVNQSKFQIGKLGNTGVTAIIASTSLSGTNLIVTLSGNNNLFRIGDVVADANYVQGKVISKAGVTITLEPMNGVTFATATHFLANTYASFLFNASKNDFSTGTETQYIVPELDYNCTAISRRSGAISRRNKEQTWVEWAGKYWYFAQEKLAVSMLAREEERKFLYSNRAFDASSVDGTYNTTGGLRWAAQNQGGIFIPLSNAITKSQFDDIIVDFGMKSAQSGRKIVAFMGREAMNALQGITEQFIQYPGSQNTFGGASVDGLNVMKYAKAGIQIEYKHCPAFDDPGFLPDLSTITGKMKKSYTIMLVDMTPTETVDGAGVVPPIQKYHFGDKEMYANYLPGMIAPDGMAGDLLKSGLAVNPVDGFGFEFLCDDGLYIVGEKIAWIELAA